MAELACYITTFNCGRAPVNVDFFASHLFDALETKLPPDLVVLCLQEIAPIGYSFLGGSFLAPYFARLSSAVHRAAASLGEDGAQYEAIAARNVGMTAIMLFARSEIKGRIRSMETGGVGVGVWDMGNKGAVGVRVGLGNDGVEDDDEVLPLTFVAAHLAPSEEKWEARNRDWKAINEGLVFTHGRNATTRTKQGGGPETEPLLEPATDSDSNTASASAKDSSLFHPLSHIFFAGDLNYRTSDTGPEPQEWRRWPADSVNFKKFQIMLRQDQLTRELEEKRTLHHLAEAPIAFPPTYKYSSSAQEQAAEAAQGKASVAVDGEGSNPGVDGWQWAKHRVPSWCDRVLYLAASAPEVHKYTALPVQPTSDHRPVALSLSVPLKQLDKAAYKVKPPFEVQPGWHGRRAAARRYEIIVGLAAYLGLTWEGEALVLGTVVGILGGWFVLRALLATA